MVGTRVGIWATVIAVLIFCRVDWVRANIINGGFETGTFRGWSTAAFFNSAGGPIVGSPTFQTFQAAQAAGTPSAHSNSVTSLQTSSFDGFGVPSPPIGPTEGRFMAYVTNATSAGDETLTGSAIRQTFVIPVGAVSLGVDLRLLNNDDPGPDFVTFNDFGGVALTRGTDILNQYNLDLDPNSTAHVHVIADPFLGGFLNQTIWFSPLFPLAGLAGQRLTLTVYDLQYGGDNSVETRLLVDNIHINPVPEPSSLLLLTTGLAVCLGYGWRRQSRSKLQRDQEYQEGQ